MTRSPLTAVALVAAAGLFAAALGCGGPPAKPVPVGVKGSVTLDGQPLADGVIDFAGKDGSPPRQLTVTAGRFEGTVPPGKYAVAVKAYREMKNPPKADPNAPGGPPDTKEQYLPGRYNADTELSADVAAGGPDLAFDLKSDPAK